MRETLYPWTGLPTKSVFVGTHVVVCLEIEEGQLLAIPFMHNGDETTLVSLWKLETPWFST